MIKNKSIDEHIRWLRLQTLLHEGKQGQTIVDDFDAEFLDNLIDVVTEEDI